MRLLCDVCGTGLPAAGGCEACGAARPSRPAESEGFGELRLVGVRCTFPCRACGFDSPLDQIDASGGVTCLKCGLHQAFPDDAWGNLLSAAHAVADLAGPEPEGAERDAVWSIARSERAARAATTTVHTLVSGPLTALTGAGHPLCTSCTHPVAVEVVGDGNVLTQCSECGEVASYASPGPAMYIGFVGAIGPEHRTDQPAATRQEDAFHCADCGAPLPVDGLGRLVKCAYCATVSRIPVASLQGLKDPPPPDLWWLVFRGPSPARKRLLLGHDEPVDLQAPPTAPGAADRILRFVLTTVALVLGGGVAVLAWLGGGLG